METIAKHVKEISSFKTIGHEVASLKENIERLNNQIHDSATCECKDSYQVRVQSRYMSSIDQNPLPDHRRVDPRALYQRPKRTVRCFWCDQLGHTYRNCMAYEKACRQHLVLENEHKICDYHTKDPLHLNLGRGGMVKYFEQKQVRSRSNKQVKKHWRVKRENTTKSNDQDNTMMDNPQVELMMQDIKPNDKQEHERSTYEKKGKYENFHNISIDSDDQSLEDGKIEKMEEQVNLETSNQSNTKGKIERSKQLRNANENANNETSFNVKEQEVFENIIKQITQNMNKSTKTIKRKNELCMQEIFHVLY
ncbi:hypothetical protein KP509_13G092900 [Ceratopteris richardii]|uniref:CCHC-type domain-containing protein n=1 Tax=Ceratopteris richardii TaxID=49495 RepID=A0A8T2TJY0_CERRI|nr:hypothetical protein KP509_13G092900 [Ceratopteris richardii]